MYYHVSLTLPPKQSESNPTIQRLILTKGVIRRILVGFPEGCAGLVHVKISDKGWQICPWTQSETLAWNNYVFDIHMEYPLYSEPYELIITAYNTDDTYQHTIFCGIEFHEGEIETGLLQTIVQLQKYMV